MIYLLVLLVLARSSLAQSLSNCFSSNGNCNCSSVGACCINDANSCSNNYQVCIAGTLARLNKTAACPCVQQYSNCFAQLICQPSDQPKVVVNCQNISSFYVSNGPCNSNSFSCNFASLPTFPTKTCSQQSSCSDCSCSSNCQWCDQNKNGVCVNLGSTCVAANTNDATSLLYPFSNGFCDISNSDILTSLNNNRQSINLKAASLFANNSALSSAGVRLSAFGPYSQSASSQLSITLTFAATSIVSQTSNFCTVSINMATMLLGVVDTTRILCNSQSITPIINGSFSFTVYINDINGPVCSASPQAPSGGGGGSSIPLIGIIAIIIFAIGVVLMIVAIIVFCVLRASRGEERV